MNNRIESFDSLRGIAAMVVVVFHCLVSFPVFYNANYNHVYDNTLVKIFSETPLKTAWAGYEAVALFFVLSGLVLAIPFLNNRAPSYKSYLIKRFCRIYIPYIVVMLISVILMTMCLGVSRSGLDSLSPLFNQRWDHHVSLKSLFAYLVMLNYDTANVNGVVWSLYHEMRISIIFPLIMIIVIRFNVVTSVVIGVGGSVMLSLLTRGVWLASMFSDTFYYLSFFVFGAVFAKYMTPISGWITPLRRHNKVALAILSLVMINVKNIAHEATSGFLMNTVFDMVLAVGILLLFAMALSSSKFASVLTKKPLLFLGKISYSLYLIHIIIIMLLSLFLSEVVPLIVIFFAVPVIAIPVAYLVYKFVELPAINLGKRITSSFKKKETINSTVVA